MVQAVCASICFRYVYRLHSSSLIFMVVGLNILRYTITATAMTAAVTAGLKTNYILMYIFQHSGW